MALAKDGFLPERKKHTLVMDVAIGHEPFGDRTHWNRRIGNECLCERWIESGGEGKQGYEASKQDRLARFSCGLMELCHQVLQKTHLMDIEELEHCRKQCISSVSNCKTSLLKLWDGQGQTASHDPGIAIRPPIDA